MTRSGSSCARTFLLLMTLNAPSRARVSKNYCMISSAYALIVAILYLSILLILKVILLVAVSHHPPKLHTGIPHISQGWLLYHCCIKLLFWSYKNIVCVSQACILIGGKLSASYALIGFIFCLPAVWLIEKRVPKHKIWYKGSLNGELLLSMQDSQWVSCTVYRSRSRSRLTLLATVIALWSYTQVLETSGLWLTGHNGLLPLTVTSTTQHKLTQLQRR